MMRKSTYMYNLEKWFHFLLIVLSFENKIWPIFEVKKYLYTWEIILMGS